VSEIHKVAYDETHSELSPGTALSAEMIAHALDHDHARKLDYLIGDDGYKRLWMSRRNSRCRLLAYDPRSAGGLAGCLRELASQARQAWRARRATDGSAGAPAAAPR
jgi:CelD/BcsL family acetyltransferase involved in cellulose biosynthesis